MSEANAGVAAVLSFLFSGLGQIYNGQIKKGLVVMFFSSVGIIAVLLGAILVGHWLITPGQDIKELVIGIAIMGLSILVICVLGVRSIFDAYNGK